MNTKQLLTAVAASAALTTFAATVPTVSSVTMEQPSSGRLVTITYNVDAEAVITLDVQTNATANAAADDPGWTSIGGQALQNAVGDVWKKVASGAHTITWRPDLSWPDHKVADGCARAVVTAWALDNTPDYMAVDISAAAQPNTQKFYPAAEFVPGGVTSDLYKTTMLLMRKIMAKDVTWTMGSVAEADRVSNDEGTKHVTLSDNYYIGVFEVTQTQWYLISAYNNSYFKVEGSMRPVENVCQVEIRRAKRDASGTSVTTSSDGVYPADPGEGSYLQLLRSKTQIDFDMPTEEQWEFAARAGHGEGYWGNGKPIVYATGENTDSNLDELGRYLNNPASNSSTAPAATTLPADGATAIVGSYQPNDWGLYDMHGNVWELTLSPSGSQFVRRGGSYYLTAKRARSASVGNMVANQRHQSNGFRLVCPVGVQ